MKLKPLNSHLLKLVKITSILLILNAIGLEFGNFYALSLGLNLPDFLDVILWVARFAMLVHLLEGMIGIIYSLFQGENWLKSGIYIFFTGTVSLAELLHLFDEQKSDVMAQELQHFSGR